MPKDKIKTAIDKAFGSGKDAANYETVVYEGYGPCGVAIYCDALTDNRNRTAPTDLMTVKKGLEEQGIEVKGAEFIMEPTTPTEVTVADAKKVMRLVDRLEELEDLQNVYHTMDITDEIAAALDEEE